MVGSVGSVTVGATGTATSLTVGSTGTVPKCNPAMRDLAAWAAWP